MQQPAAGPTDDDARAGTRLAWWMRAGGALPLGVLHVAGAAIGWLLCHVFRFRRGIADANLARCFPELTRGQRARLLGQHYREWAQGALELLKLARFSREELVAAIDFHGAGAVHAALAAGQPQMLLSAHQGNWEWLLQRIAVEFQEPFVCAYKPLRSAGMDRQMRALRERFGARLAPAKALPRYLARLRGSAHLVALAADQMPASSPSRVWLQFFGQTTAFYPGPAELARRYGYDAWFMAVERLAPGRYSVGFEPLDRAGDALALTKRYAARLEASIRAHPADWAWGHRRWKVLPGVTPDCPPGDEPPRCDPPGDEPPRRDPPGEEPSA